MWNWLTRRRQPPVTEVFEHRATPRVAVTREKHGHLRASVGIAGWPAAIHDISLGGIGLVVGLRHERGDALWMTLFNTRFSERYLLQVRVAHVQHRHDGYWALGCTFFEPIHAAELKALLEKKAIALSGRLRAGRHGARRVISSRF